MQQEVTFFVEDLEAVLEMNRLLEKENQELKQEVSHLKGEIIALKANNVEKKQTPYKRTGGYTVEGDDKEETRQAAATGRAPEGENVLKETQLKRAAAAAADDQPKGRVDQMIPQKPLKLASQQEKLPPASPLPPATPPATAPLPPPPPPPLPSRSLVGLQKVRRVPEVIEFYRFLNKRNSQVENRTGTTGTSSEANSRNMIGEIENRSTYLSAVKSDVETQAEFINFLTREVQLAAFTDIDTLEAFVKWLDGELSCLIDERAVLKHFPQWPERKADALREAACCYRDLKNLESEVLSFKDHPKHTSSQILRRIQALQDRLERATNHVERTRDGACKRYRELQIPWEWMLDTGLIGQIKLSSLRLANEYMKRIAKELHTSKCSNSEDLTLQGVRFAYRVHQFAGGFDTDTKRSFEELKRLHSTFRQTANSRSETEVEKNLA
ncbi:hypothetical protein Dimus_009822 [Dionaea muscipula]